MKLSKMKVVSKSDLNSHMTLARSILILKYVRKLKYFQHCLQPKVEAIKSKNLSGQNVS